MWAALYWNDRHFKIAIAKLSKLLLPAIYILLHSRPHCLPAWNCQEILAASNFAETKHLPGKSKPRRKYRERIFTSQSNICPLKIIMAHSIKWSQLASYSSCTITRTYNNKPSWFGRVDKGVRLSGRRSFKQRRAISSRKKNIEKKIQINLPK